MIDNIIELLVLMMAILCMKNTDVVYEEKTLIGLNDERIKLKRVRFAVFQDVNCVKHC